MNKLFALPLTLLATLAVLAQSPKPKTVFKTADIVPDKGHVVDKPDPDAVRFQVSTNVTVQWMPLRQVSTNGVRSLGFLTTNKVAMIYHDGITNVVLLKQLGQEAFPSQQATNIVVGDPRARRFGGGPAR